jgi:hypothetical protein
MTNPDSFKKVGQLQDEEQDTFSSMAETKGKRPFTI